MLVLRNTEPKTSPTQNLNTNLLPVRNESISVPSVNTNQAVPTVVIPIDGFWSRVTKKPFGIKIDPATSPVQPERFSGYHTAVDAETSASEANMDIPIRAVAAGTVLLARIVDGYGGFMAIQHSIDGQQMIGVYGHLRASSFTVKSDDKVSVGQVIGVLGTGYSSETSGERKHLHFGLIRGTTLTYRGYVATQSELSGWLDPVVVLRAAGAL